MMLFGTGGDAWNLRTFAFRHAPFFYQLPCVLVLEVLFVLLLLDPERKVAFCWTQNEAFWKYANWTDPHLVGWFDAENVVELPLYLKIIAYRSNHEQLPSICPNQYFCLIKPCMCSEISCFWQFLYIFIRFKWVILNFKQLENVFPCARDQVRLSRTNHQWLSAFNCEIAHSQASASWNVQEHQLIVGFGGHAA